MISVFGFQMSKAVFNTKQLLIERAIKQTDLYELFRLLTRRTVRAESAAGQRKKY
jgi:hypothetical protein